MSANDVATFAIGGGLAGMFFLLDRSWKMFGAYISGMSVWPLIWLVERGW